MALTHDPHLHADPDDRLPERRGALAGPAARALLALLVALLLGGGWWWWMHPAPAPAPGAPAAVQAVPDAPDASAPAATAAAPDVPEPAPDPSPLTAADVPAALAALFGPQAVSDLLLTDDFPRRFVATVDALGREHAPRQAWPVRPAPGRFDVQGSGEAATIAPANAARYTAFVQLAGGIDAEAAARAYRRMHPLLQHAYTELGFGSRSFHARLLEVIDLLLATPEPAEPPRMVLTEVHGPIAPQRPWERYEFADPRLQSLAAGQKILLRMGPGNERRLKAKLAELRRALAATAAPR